MGTGIRPSIDCLAGQKKWDWYIQSTKKEEEEEEEEEEEKETAS